MPDTTNELRKVLSHFNIEDIQTIVLTEFPELEWLEIQNRVIENRRSLTKKYIVEAFDKICAEKITKEQREARIITLKLIALCKSKSRIWCAFELQSKIEDLPVDAEELSQRICKTFERFKQKVTVNCVNFDCRTVGCLFKSSAGKSGAVRVSAPFYFQYFANSRSLFCLRASVKMENLDVIANCLGYERVKSCRLNGKCVNELYRLMRCRDGGALNAEALVAPARYKPSYNGCNFNQASALRGYGRKLSGGNEPPVIQNLTIALDHCEWDVLPEHFTCGPIREMSVTISAPSVFELLSEMIAEGLVETPAPPYIAAIIKKGSNHLSLRTQNS